MSEEEFEGATAVAENLEGGDDTDSAKAEAAAAMREFEKDADSGQSPTGKGASAAQAESRRIFEAQQAQLENEVKNKSDDEKFLNEKTKIDPRYDELELRVTDIPAGKKYKIDDFVYKKDSKFDNENASRLVNQNGKWDLRVKGGKFLSEMLHSTDEGEKTEDQVDELKLQEAFDTAMKQLASTRRAVLETYNRKGDLISIKIFFSDEEGRVVSVGYNLNKKEKFAEMDDDLDLDPMLQRGHTSFAGEKINGSDEISKSGNKTTQLKVNARAAAKKPVSSQAKNADNAKLDLQQQTGAETSQAISLFKLFNDNAGQDAEDAVVQPASAETAVEATLAIESGLELDLGFYGQEDLNNIYIYEQPIIAIASSTQNNLEFAGSLAPTAAQNEIAASQNNEISAATQTDGIGLENNFFGIEIADGSLEGQKSGAEAEAGNALLETTAVRPQMLSAFEAGSNINQETGTSISAKLGLGTELSLDPELTNIQLLEENNFSGQTSGISLKLNGLSFSSAENGSSQEQQAAISETLRNEASIEAITSAFTIEAASNIVATGAVKPERSEISNTITISAGAAGNSSASKAENGVKTLKIYKEPEAQPITIVRSEPIQRAPGQPQKEKALQKLRPEPEIKITPLRKEVKPQKEVSAEQPFQPRVQAMRQEVKKQRPENTAALQDPELGSSTAVKSIERAARRAEAIVEKINSSRQNLSQRAKTREAVSILSGLRTAQRELEILRARPASETRKPGNTLSSNDNGEEDLPPAIINYPPMPVELLAQAA